MANIRAYKLAEELGIEKNDLVERAHGLGIELKSAMASLDDRQANSLRESIGSPLAKSRSMTEERLEGKSGATVLRRRKRVEPVPVPEPEPEVVPEPVVADEEQAAEAPEAGIQVAADGALSEPRSEAEGGEDAGAEEGVAAEGQSAAGTPGPTDGKADEARRTTTVRPEQPAVATPDRKGKQRKRVREVVNLQEQEQFAKQITGRGGQVRRVTSSPSGAVANPRRKRRDKLAPLVAKPTSEQKRVVKVEGEISVGELAKLLGAKAPAIQGKLMALGTMVSINQLVGIEICRQIAKEFGYEVVDTGFKEEAFLDTGIAANEATASAEETSEVPDENRVVRPPVITVMGHVDHGKTSLLDALRNARSNVVDGEAGGITQHIGAYQIDARGHRLTFIDTPGHAAFTAMRARGAAVTDIVVLVVAANDGVMPQTVEAIEHAQAAGCPIVVAINKVDLEDADPDRVRQRLTEHNLVPEEFGGDVICVNVSAKTGEGFDQLLEMLALQAEVLELRADSTKRAAGVVLEARLDKGRGAVATVLVQDGTLRRGDVMVVGTGSGRVRVMEGDTGEKLTEAGPSTPVQVIGLSAVPLAGASFHVVESDRIAKQITSHREDQQRGKTDKPKPKLTLEEFFARAEGEGPKELAVVLKADVQGTCEAVRDALEELSTDAVKLKILSSGVGAINENDVMLATASGAIVIGFHVRPDTAARRASDSGGVDLRTYTVIMNLLDEVRAAMAGLLPPTYKEVMLGRAEVKQPFTIPKVGTIAGSLVVEGKIVRHAKARLVRDGVQIYEGTIGSLRRFKDDTKEVQNGFECGIGIDFYNDIKIGDIIEVFELEELPPTL